jgi:hypothetical protein
MYQFDNITYKITIEIFILLRIFFYRTITDVPKTLMFSFSYYEMIFSKVISKNIKSLQIFFKIHKKYSLIY